jgi:hypothetical protein
MIKLGFELRIFRISANVRQNVLTLRRNFWGSLSELVGIQSLPELLRIFSSFGLSIVASGRRYVLDVTSDIVAREKNTEILAKKRSEILYRHEYFGEREIQPTYTPQTTNQAAEPATFNWTPGVFCPS